MFVTMVRLTKPGWLRAVVAESMLARQQLLILNRGRKRGPNLKVSDRFIAGFLNDTWVWDGENWTQESPATSPPARYDHAMAYDSERGQVMVFGGSARFDTRCDQQERSARE